MSIDINFLFTEVNAMVARWFADGTPIYAVNKTTADIRGAILNCPRYSVDTHGAIPYDFLGLRNIIAFINTGTNSTYASIENTSSDPGQGDPGPSGGQNNGEAGEGNAGTGV